MKKARLPKSRADFLSLQDVFCYREECLRFRCRKHVMRLRTDGHGQLQKLATSLADEIIVDRKLPSDFAQTETQTD